MSEEPRNTVSKPVDLESFSEDELMQKIADLKAEIEACEAELAKKQAHRSAADALFKSR